MALTAPQQAPATGFYEVVKPVLHHDQTFTAGVTPQVTLSAPLTGLQWVLPGFMRSNEEEIDSPTFQIGGYMW